MPSLPILTDYACEQPCKYCTVTGRCPRIRLDRPTLTAGKQTFEYLPAMSWRPGASGSEDIALHCGDTIPWPVIQAFGQQIHGQVWCSVHGWQPKLTKKDIEKAAKAARKRKKAGDTFDDIPDF